MSSSPIKTTVVSSSTSTCKNPNHNKIEHSPPSIMNEKGKVTAVVAVAKYGNAHHHKSSKKAAKKANPSSTR